ncbi:MAG: HU family DNA-binding protein [Rhizobiales bacterium]|nr:HU family DNA-binding protein [Hyphomicrobiales bacterium]
MADEKEKIATIALSKITAELADKHDMSKKAVGDLLGAFVDLTVKHLKKGNKVRVTGLGIFQVRKRPARMGRNPATGEAMISDGCYYQQPRPSRGAVCFSAPAPACGG